jgi:hypothetical protein
MTQLQLLRCLPLLAWLPISGLSLAQPVPPPPMQDDVGVPSLRVRPATRLSLGKFVAYFEKTTLAQVRNAVGAGTIAHQGDAGESMYWLCYTAARVTPPQRLWIMSHGEMGGPEHDVGGVVVEEIPPSVSANSGCPMLPFALMPISLDRGVWLGTTPTVLSRKLGQPSRVRHDWLDFVYEGKVPGKDPFGSGETVNFSELSSLSARVVTGRVVALHAWKVTAY